MTRQNRVTPRSEIVALVGRGLFMGNRGCLHDRDGRIVRQWRGRLWICCLTAFRGRRRDLMQPGRYTELFFLDEAVAFAAGHRPCAECRRADYLRLRAAWNMAGLPDAPRAADLDRHLHGLRHPSGQGDFGQQAAPAGHLPDGTFVEHAGTPHLWAMGALRPWAPAGYGAPVPAPAGPLAILTPMPFVRCLAHGYRPALHPTAHR